MSPMSADHHRVWVFQVVKSLESAEKNPKAIENWIESIRDLHRSKPPPNVHYSR